MNKQTNQILYVVRDFLKVHDKLEGKYWPMLEIFLQRLEKGIPEKKITTDFHKAYRDAKQLQLKVEIPGYWYNIISNLLTLSSRGRAWIEDHRSKGFGFWRLLELAKFEPDVKAMPDPKKKSKLRNQHYRYFIEESPSEFPSLCATYLEKKRLPDFAGDKKEERLYERMCVRMLEILLHDKSFHFDPQHNWSEICLKILQKIKSKSKAKS